MGWPGGPVSAPAGRAERDELIRAFGTEEGSVAEEGQSREGVCGFRPGGGAGGRRVKGARALQGHRYRGICEVLARGGSVVRRMQVVR